MASGAVLIVHSDREVRSLLQGLLVSLAPVGFKTFANAKDALIHLKTLPADSMPAILFDWHLAEIQGAAFLERAKEVVPNFIPVAISNVISEEDSFFLTELGIWHVIKTNESGKKIQLILKKILELQKAPQEDSDLVSDFQKSLANENEDECTQLLLENPNLSDLLSSSPSSIHMLAEYYLLIREPTQAIELLKNFLDPEKKEKSAEVLRVLSTMGRALCQAGYFDDALIIFEKLAEKSPKNLKYTINKGDVLLEAGRTTEAQAQYESALNIDPDRKDALNGLAKVHLVRGEDPDNEPLSAL